MTTTTKDYAAMLQRAQYDLTPSFHAAIDKHSSNLHYALEKDSSGFCDLY
jgi:hypothetical protein